MVTLRGRILSPEDKHTVTYLEDAVIVVNDTTGKIEEVCEYDGRAVDRDLRPCVITPGFVDTHIHLPQFRAVGSATGTLLEWLNTSIFPEEQRFQDVSHAEKIALHFVDSLAAAGTTLSFVYGSVHAKSVEYLFRAAEEKGMRCIAGPVLMDQNSPEALCVPKTKALNALQALVDRWHGKNDLLQTAVIPRFALSCSMDLMQAAGKMALEQNLLVSTHVSETTKECEVACKMHNATDYLSIYEKASMLHPRSIFAHCIHFSEEEWNRFEKSGAAIAHCADSNFFLGSGRMDVQTVIDREIPMGIGSDVAAGRSFRIPRHLASTYDNGLTRGIKLPEETLFWYGTRGGALALGCDNVGQIKVGMDADLVCLEVPDFASSAADVMQWAFLDHDAPRPVATWVRGKQVWDRAAWAQSGAGYVWRSNKPSPIS